MAAEGENAEITMLGYIASANFRDRILQSSVFPIYLQSRWRHVGRKTLGFLFKSLRWDRESSHFQTGDPAFKDLGTKLIVWFDSIQMSNDYKRLITANVPKCAVLKGGK